MQDSGRQAAFGHAGENGLENQLRSMILTNAAPGNTSSTTSTLPGSSGPVHNAARVPMGEHGSASIPIDGKAPVSPKMARKRPNQAQRRQMNAELSIPIDPRPSPPTHYGRPYSGSPGHQSHPPGFHHRGGGPHHSGSYRGHGPARGQYGRGQSHAPRHNGSHYPPNVDTSGYHEQPHFGHRQDNGSPRFARNNHGTLYSPRGPPHQVRPEELENQAAFLERLCSTLVAGAEIERGEIAEKENFRRKIEEACRAAVTEYELSENGIQDFPSNSVELKCFGSLSSGFATKASDMDLGLVSPLSQPQPDDTGSAIPRIIEKAFLDLGLGARLLTRTRVPIIKLCEKPPEKLRLDLLEEREKWEKGVVDTDRADAADEDEHVDGDNIDPKEATDESMDDPTSQKTDVSSPLVAILGEPQGFKLQQSENNSLPAYYNLAKRVLRRHGGRDITLSNCRELTEDDFQLLNKVCKEFVMGLHDKELKRRLLAYRSLAFSPLPDAPNHRSLAGVFTQMEGERIVMLCESNTEIEGTDEGMGLSLQPAIEEWKALQDQLHFGVDPLAYTKQLQMQYERLRRTPVVQLFSLAQNQHETAAGYYARAQKIFIQLKARHIDEPVKHEFITVGEYCARQDARRDAEENAANKLKLDKYIDGIWLHSIRAQVREFANRSDMCMNIVAVVRRHMSFQIAHEFEKALDHGLYDPTQEADIKEYISLLRGPLRRNPMVDARAQDYLVPVTKQDINLVKRMREFQDPSTLPVNQPRDPYRDKLEFPKSGVGVQCDINFAAHLALHNTLLLRCYSHTDPRVRPLVLFVKHWAKARGINTPYRGTLSSYGYVLMVLHYLVNIVQPFVCPNLQQLGPQRPPEGTSPTGPDDDVTMCRGRFVGFWRDEAEILRLAQMNQLNGNRESIGQLLRGFFEYYAQNGAMSTYSGRGYDWGRDVLSIRTPGGLLSKAKKGWTGAKTVIEYRPSANANSPVVDHRPYSLPEDPDTPTTQEASSPTTPAAGKTNAAAAANKNGEVKEVRHRYLFAIEDPFELDHNVARTVTHNGIVAIRDEFRRAWRIIRAAGTGYYSEELLEDVSAAKDDNERGMLGLLMNFLHGGEIVYDE
ncbi:caffeine-induced death protein 1 [Colletotrichum musicola]|uniref:polynucleotide adenylyltransferase n=1 Tax=Colletotrichum musicola TaxID=2175873 RepID=A0A8H6KEP3_9PEZI|nr:caffeine-induced death protein 1 [Colletotrichum musicola]